MRPVLFSVFGFDIQSYGVSKALAALVAVFVLTRAFEKLGLKRDSAHSLVMWATIWGFAGAKVYYLLEHLPTFTIHDLGGMGFTWYGGLIGGVLAALVIVHRHQLPLSAVADAAAVPLTVAYGIGRLGCPRSARADPAPALGARQPDSRRQAHRSHPAPEHFATHDLPGDRRRRGSDRAVERLTG